jgi:hypothetical protein
MMQNKDTNIQSFIHIVFCACLVFILYSCSRSSDNMLLQGKEYKLWYIDERDANAYQFLYVKRKEVRFVHLSSDEFVPNSDTSAYWKMKNDYIMILDNDLYSLKVMGKNPDSVLLCNLKTNDSIKIIDTGFPPDLNDIWGDEIVNKRDREHYEKWGDRIKVSPLLQGHDYKLWFVHVPDDDGIYEKTIPPPPPPHLQYHAVQYPNRDTVYFDFDARYYRKFVYFDKYGKMISFFPFVKDAERWYFVNPLYCTNNAGDDQIHVSYWHAGNDTVFFDGKMYQITVYDEYKLKIKNLETNKVSYLLEVYLPPKPEKVPEYIE